MGNFIVCRYLGNGFCEYWAVRIESFIQSFTAWILLHLQAAVLPAGCNKDFICLCVVTEKKELSTTVQGKKIKVNKLRAPQVKTHLR